ncbi:methenyltetrahydrofolate synthase domain-containing protein isoform X1 [Brachyhypopomus gauderio]|uniref:methenyltetrahydrofolate synthase domain-containing protein isoform X1 n=2 Tax=Brachyhypopomus gauderio TaxID=698409 RepID=UPI004042478B
MEHTIVIHAGATKWDIRQRVWDYIEEKNLANFPRPVHHRIPNFKGAEGACNKIVRLDVFSKTSEVKVDPDKPLEGARLASLQARKVLLVPTPRLRTGLFNKIVPPQNSTNEELRVCSTSRGVKDFSIPLGLDANIQVDLVVVGSVAVSQEGYRIGKGEGFADLEYGMMAAMGAVNESTVVVTIVHDCQVVNIPEGLIESHDLTVDYILTPTRIIKTECRHPKPQGIMWAKLDAETLEKIPILRKLRVLEQEAGRAVTLKSSPVEALPAGQATDPRRPHPGLRPDANQKPKHVCFASAGDGGERDEGGGVEHEFPKSPAGTLYLGGIPAGLRVGELKRLLRERHATPHKLTWQGPRGSAFLHYSDGPAAGRALAALQGLSVDGHTLRAERARGRRGGHRADQTTLDNENIGVGRARYTL